MSAPSPGWRLMTSNSSSVSALGLFRMRAGVLILPASCTEAAICTFLTSSGGSPIRSATISALRATRREWPSMNGSRASSERGQPLEDLDPVVRLGPDAVGRERIGSEQPGDLAEASLGAHAAHEAPGP